MALTGTCHCGAARWRFDSAPADATACNCTVCRRYGALWIYGHEGEDVSLAGPTSAYSWGHRSIAFHFCAGCGSVMAWRSLEPGPDGRRRMAVNLRMAEPALVAAIPLQRFDGLETFDDLPRDGRCVADLWF
jgi:hypothetical protein